MPRILCLHGYGTSAAILRHQLGPFMAAADPSYEFVLLEGETECQKAQGVGNFVKGPFLCYNASFAPADVQQSCDLIDDFVEAEGPFDGILGFSQGGSVALTYLLQRQLDGHLPPFRFAIFLSTVVAFSPDETFGSHLLANLTDREIHLLDSYPTADLSSLHPLNRALCETTARAFYSAKTGGFIAQDTKECGFARRDDPAQPRVFHPALVKDRIPIPTVHITGKKDQAMMVNLSVLVQGLCDPRLIRSLTHSGAHDVPRRPDDVCAAWAAVDWAIQQSQQQYICWNSAYCASVPYSPEMKLSRHIQKRYY
ncbi:serine hydrolase FSH [Aspergillus candidus]|uniref:Serine hydrolase FSH n=1 Tax=Aspergillus candidus TaxID=41067 RepID=A0A2I2FGE6_ASPCN|nr:serine hydrolase FSH [Aspergillus candidus]PLB39702.1 serine hydrolase FSH [Aspergillus candidus]